MGLLDTKLMNRIRRALDEKYGRGEILLFGEPWAADDTASEGKVVMALKKNVSQLDKYVGMFCDDTRAVSYTHLVMCLLNERAMKKYMKHKNPWKKAYLYPLIASIPVSYTHLDVYKRQECKRSDCNPRHVPLYSNDSSCMFHCDHDVL